MKRYFLFALMVAVFMVSQFVYAQPNEGNSMPMNRMGRMLDLTDEQQSQIEDLRLSFQKEKLPLQSKIYELRTGLKLELTKENYDEKKVNQMLDQIESIRTEIHKKRINHMRSVRNILNDDQKKKFDMHMLSGRVFKHNRHMSDNAPHQRMRPGRGFRD